MNPLDVKAMRNAAGLSSAEAARLVGLNAFGAWQRYERATGTAREIPEPTLRLFYLNAFGLPRLLDALAFAARAHKGQTRKGPGKDPYLVHPILVARLLVRPGLVTDPDVLTAAILHDVVEDGWASQQDIAQQFGPGVASVVAEVTIDQTLPWAERRALALGHAAHYSPAASALKLADMAANALDLRLSPPDIPPEKIAVYRKWMLDMLKAMPAPNKRLARLLRAEARGGHVD